MEIKDFFTEISNPNQLNYEMLRDYYMNSLNAEQVAKKYNRSIHTVYALAKKFKKQLKESNDNPFFKEPALGRKISDKRKIIEKQVIELRKNHLSISQIISILQGQNIKIYPTTVWDILKTNGFEKLPRRSKPDSFSISTRFKSKPPKSLEIPFKQEEFYTENAAILTFLPLCDEIGLKKIIEKVELPDSKTISKLSSILSFLALKLSGINRYSHDDIWCYDRGLGFFAGLNVLPKSSWFSSYSTRITKQMNQKLLSELNQKWQELDLLSDTVNLDFTSLPYWGNAEELENHWSGTRNKALKSIVAALAQDPESGIIVYGDTTKRNYNMKDCALEFLDFWKEDEKGNKKDIKYLVFDSKFTTYKNLSQLNKLGIKFLTIRRKGKNIKEQINKIPASSWKEVRIQDGDGKNRKIKVFSSLIDLKDYEGKIRNIVLKSNRLEATMIITNETQLKDQEIVKKYARRWIVEKCISEQLQFFHLNRLSSSMVIKVDFDLIMTLLAYNLYRIFAMKMEGFEKAQADTINRKFIHNGGNVMVEKNLITVELKKKKYLPFILENLNRIEHSHILTGKKIKFVGASTS